MKYAAVFLLGISLVACKGDKEKKGGDSSSAQTSAATTSAAESSAATSAAASSEATAESDADYIHILASHADPKPTDPVKVALKDWKVTAAKFDPKNLAGGTATLTIPIATLSSGNEKRDGHLKSEDILNIAKFPEATVSIDNVAGSDKSYTADATVTFRDKEEKIPLKLEVLSSDDSSVKVKATGDFTIGDFDIPDADGAIGKKLQIESQFTLQK